MLFYRLLHVVAVFMLVVVYVYTCCLLLARYLFVVVGCRACLLFIVVGWCRPFVGIGWLLGGFVIRVGSLLIVVCWLLE